MSFELTITQNVIRVSLATGAAAQGLPGPQGLQGVQGLTGGVGAAANGAAFPRLSSAAINAGRVVRFVGDDHAAHADATQLAHMSSVAGLALTSASAAEQSIDVVRSGEFVDNGWNWTAGQPVFLSTDGTLTQTFSPSWAFALVVGVALSAHRIAVGIEDPIKL